MNHLKANLWRHQLDFHSQARRQHGTLFHGGMGVGKTLASLALMPPLTGCKYLIVAPKVMLQTWRAEINDFVIGNYDVLVLDKGSVSVKASRLSKAFAQQRVQGKALYVIVNYESVWRGELATLALSEQWDAVVADECHRIKTPGSKQSKFMSRLGQRTTKRLALSGTPFPQGPLDAYAIYRFVDPATFGQSFYAFRNRYAIMGGFGGKQVVGYQREQELSDKINRSRFYAGRDLLDLPDAVHNRVLLQLPHHTKGAYRSVERDMYAWIKEAGTEVTAANALVKLLRLQQMTSGYVRGDDEKLTSLHTVKHDAAVEILEDISPDEKVVVFCRFRHDIQSAINAANAAGRPAYEISGSLNELLAWRAGEPDAVLCVQIDSGSEGISLVDARHVIMWSVGFSLAKYLQALARTHRPGQDRTCFYHHLVMENTVDEKVYTALQKKQDIIESIIGEVQ